MSRIELLEDQIGDLAASIRQSQKFMLAGRLCAAAGLLALVIFATSSAADNLTWLSLGVAGVLGGLVLAGASKRSTEDLTRALERAEMERTQAISALDLQDVSNIEARTDGPSTG